MCTIIVDDESKERMVLSNEIISNGYNVNVFNDSDSAAEFLKSNRADLAFVSLCSKNIDYDLIIRKVKKIDFRTVVFLIGNDDIQSTEVYKKGCDYFIKKPYNPNEIRALLKRFELLSKRLKKRVFVRTFGRFDVFVDGVPVDFHNSKAKELFALCIDHCGGNVTMQEAIDKLWYERHYDDKVKRLYRKAVISIVKTLQENDVSKIFVKSRGTCAINKNAIECDYFNLIKNPQKYADTFHGEYIFDYSWAESTLANIAKRLDFKY